MKKRVEIIAHPDIWQGKYARRQGEPDRSIGIPFQQDELEGLGAMFRLTSPPVHIGKGVMTTGEIPMETDFEQVDGGLFVKEGSAWKPNNVRSVCGKRLLP
jgi:7,8-dihydropterin-6-yl-methyl-4-(beta-D-ribofuranosyl)aminobenzene 5'-phosphate synthase